MTQYYVHDAAFSVVDHASVIPNRPRNTGSNAASRNTETR